MLSSSLSPINLTGLGLMLILLFSCTGFFSYKEFQSFPAEPQHILLAEAQSLVARQQKAWVVVDDLRWDCNHLFEKEDNPTGRGMKTINTYIPFTNVSGNVWGMTYFSGAVSCNAIRQWEKEAMGVLWFINENEFECLQSGCAPSTYEDLIDNGFSALKHQPNGKILFFCHNCGGGENARNNMGFSLSMIVLGLLLILFAIFLQTFVNRAQTTRQVPYLDE